MSRLEIPGYYFDEQKGKYFKIEKSHLAPSSAAYSSDNVKRRKLEDEEHRSAEERKQLLRNHIRRHGSLQRSNLATALLDREVGLPSAAHGVEARCTATYGESEIRGRAWARGLEGKGQVSFAPSYVRERMPNMGCFWVDGSDDFTGMGVAYGGMDEETLVGSYIPTDENERICFAKGPEEMRPRQRPAYRTEIVRCPQMSSIRYHAPSHKMLITSREMDRSAGLYIFSPAVSEEWTHQPRWLLGEANMYQRLASLHRARDQWVVHSSTPAPPSFTSTLCLLSTNAGILRVASSEAIIWLSTPPAQTASSSSHSHKDQPELPREIFSADFSTTNPEVVYAGGRQARLWKTDMRTVGRDWSFDEVGSSLSHVRCLNDRELLVAGPQDLMAIYDVRMLASGNVTAADLGAGGKRTGGASRLAKPVVTFPEYKNSAHIHTGLDVSADLGVVAAGMGDGTVKLFSLMSGRRLKTGGFATAAAAAASCRAEKAGRGKNTAAMLAEVGGYGGLETVQTDTPIKAVQFQKMPWERWDSLWVAEGPALRKFSFGTRDLEDDV